MAESQQLSAAEKIILAVDKSTYQDVERLTRIAQEAGSRYVKYGLAALFSIGPATCAAIAANFGLDWVADAKLKDIPNTVNDAVDVLADLVHPPFGITMHTTAGREAMMQAQAHAGTIKMLGVTVLTSIQDNESELLLGSRASPKAVQLAHYAAMAGLAGVVASPLEVAAIKTSDATRHLFAMIPGTRLAGTEHHDQARVGSPAQAIADGANLLVIGRAITGAEDPSFAFRQHVEEIQLAMPA